MEMLSNFWTALSTENVELVELIIIPFRFIECFLSLVLFINLLNIKASNKQKLLYFLLTCASSTLTSAFIPSPFNLICNYVFLFIIIYFTFRQGILKTLISLFVPVITFGLVSVLISNFYIKVLNITYEQTELTPIYRLPYLFIVFSTVSFINIVLKHKNLKIKILEDFDKKTKVIVILNFILGLVAIFIQAILIAYYIDIVPVFITFLSFIVLIAYFVINLYTVSRITKLTVTTRELQTAEEYNKSITVLYDNVKGFKHDFDNIVSSIGGYVDTNDMEGLKEYYYSLREDCQKTNNIAMLNPNIINNPAIYSLLSSKYHKADSLGIKVNFEFFVDLNEFKINSYEFSRILGILLDNAIEAASVCENKIVNIYFRNEFNKNRHIVLISNTYINKDVDTEEIFQKGKSGKENHSGLGLWEVRQYIKKNNNLNLYTSKNNKYFSQQLEIYYNKK